MHLVRFDPKLNISRQAQQRVAHQTRHRPSSRCVAHHPQNPNATKSRPFIRSDGSHLQLPQINIKWAVGRFPSLTPSPFSFPIQQSQPQGPAQPPGVRPAAGHARQRRCALDAPSAGIWTPPPHGLRQLGHLRRQVCVSGRPSQAHMCAGPDAS